MPTLKSSPRPKSRIPADDERRVSPNFLTEIIDADLRSGKVESVVTRFPPEPNGYAHILHAFASFISYGVAQDYGGQFNLRLDDTNPETEKREYAEAQIRDLAWLGLEWQDRLYYASDYFERLYALAVRLIEEGEAYVDSLSEAEIQSYRGTVTEAGRESPYRQRSVVENLDLFERMRQGEFPEGAHVLRAKIDMGSPNMKLRDPILYRIMHTPHYRTGETWRVYPMYDFAHPLSDALEGISHSLCSLEFVENRAVYDWLLKNLFPAPRPHQYEFGRRSLEYTITSKRKLIQLVEGGFVTGWDDPRMPTLAGLRRLGVRPEAVRDFASRVGISRTNRTVDIALLDYAVRDNLNDKAPRVMAVLDPIRVVLTNYEGEGETLHAPYWPPDIPREGTRPVAFGRELYLEREDFAEEPPKGFKRLSPGEHVRLRHAYVIRCDEVVKDERGEVVELRCTYFPDSLGQNPSGVKVKGAIHWVAAEGAVPAEFRLYDRLFDAPDPSAGEGDFLEHLNPESLQVKRGFVERSVQQDPPETRYQFERQGYFWQDPEDSEPSALVFNRIVNLKQSTEIAFYPLRNLTHTKQAEVTMGATDSNKAAAKAGVPKDPVLNFSGVQKADLERFLALGVARDDALLIAENPKLSRYFEEALAAHDNPQGVANWLVNDLRPELSGLDPAELPFAAADLAELVRLIDEGVITTRAAKEVFAEMRSSGRKPSALVREGGLEQLSDAGELGRIAERLIAENPDEATAYRNGKTGLMGFFVGQAMRETQGKANPQLLQDLLQRKLSGQD